MSLACDLLRDTSMTVCKKGLISEELQCSPDDLLVFMHFLPKFDETLGIDPIEEIRGIKNSAANFLQDSQQNRASGRRGLNWGDGLHTPWG